MAKNDVVARHEQPAANDRDAGFRRCLTGDCDEGVLDSEVASAEVDDTSHLEDDYAGTFNLQCRTQRARPIRRQARDPQHGTASAASSRSCPAHGTGKSATSRRGLGKRWCDDGGRAGGRSKRASVDHVGRLGSVGRKMPRRVLSGKK